MRLCPLNLFQSPRRNLGVPKTKSQLSERMLPPLFHGPVNLPLGIPPGDALPLIVELFALAQPNGNLHTGPLQIDRQRNQGVTILFHQPIQPEDLPFVHQKAARAHGIFIKDIPLLIRADVHPQNKQFPVFDATIGIFQVEPAGPNGFHLGARQGYTRFVGLFHKKSCRAFLFCASSFVPSAIARPPFCLFLCYHGESFL